MNVMIEISNYSYSYISTYVVTYLHDVPIRYVDCLPNCLEKENYELMVDVPKLQNKNHTNFQLFRKFWFLPNIETLSL